MAINKGYLTCDKSEKGDEVYTPFYAVQPLLEFLPKLNCEGRKNIYWLPFDEEWSAFNQLLKENDYKVVRSSLKEGKDFFDYEPDAWDIAVSNPPFSLKDKVLKRMYSFNKPFALLLPLNSIQGQARFEIFSEDIQLLAFDKRVNYHRNQNFQTFIAGNCFASAYFCRKLLPERLVFRKLDEYERNLK